MLRIVVDANGYLSRVLGNYYLHLGHITDVQLIWSKQLLHEVEKNAPKVWKATPSLAHRFVETMRQYHPNADVQVTERDLSALRQHDTGVDEGDLAILATAIQGGADLLATENFKHFYKAADWMNQYGLTLVNHGEALEMIASRHPEAVSDVHRFLLDGQYRHKGEAHIFEMLRRSTEGGELAVFAIRQAVEDAGLSDSSVSEISETMGSAYGSAWHRVQMNKRQAQQKFGADVVWVGAHTTNDGTQVDGYWRRVRGAER